MLIESAREQCSIMLIELTLMPPGDKCDISKKIDFSCKILFQKRLRK